MVDHLAKCCQKIKWAGDVVGWKGPGFNPQYQGQGAGLLPRRGQSRKSLAMSFGFQNRQGVDSNCVGDITSPSDLVMKVHLLEGSAENTMGP